MSYLRVIPRDLFNEANLLKCYGRIYINLELENLPDVELEHNNGAFDVRQDPGDGSLYLANVKLVVRGTVCRLRRPLNSRDGWPLYLVDDEDGDMEVFNEDGSFTQGMLDFLRGT